MGPQVLLKVVTHDMVQDGRSSIAPHLYVHFARALQVDVLEVLSRKYQLKDVERGQGLPLQCYQKCRVS